MEIKLNLIGVNVQFETENKIWYILIPILTYVMSCIILLLASLIAPTIIQFGFIKAFYVFLLGLIMQKSD